MSESPCEPRAKRQKVDRNGKFAAFARLKELKGSKNKCVVGEEVDNVYDEVDEKEYTKRVLSRADDDWIEDDGTGYVEDGREIFDDVDDTDELLEHANKNEKSGKNKKRGREAVTPAKGKASIRNMFSNVIKKKKEVVNIESDEILASILGEINEIGPKPISSPSMRTTSAESSKFINRKTAQNEELLAKEYMQSFATSKNTQQAKEDDEMVERLLKPEKKKVPTKVPTVAVPQPRIVVNEPEVNIAPILHEPVAPVVEVNTAPMTTVDIADDDDDDFNNLDFSVIDEAAQNQSVIEEAVEESETPKNKMEAPSEKFFLTGWNNACPDLDQSIDTGNADVDAVTATDISNENEMKFWYWDAWEDPNMRPGEVYLFGRLPLDKETNESRSICVHVKNIEKVLFLLPREHHWDPRMKESSDKPVTMIDVYTEFNDVIATDLGIDTFLSRKTTKKYPFSAPVGVDVPEVCEYLEVHYNGKHKSPNLTKRYSTIAHIFGSNTNALESFLLERKIKGPCWLKLKNFTVNPVNSSWCKVEVTCTDSTSVEVLTDDKTPPVPLKFVSLNIRTAINPKTLRNEVVMIGCIVNNKFALDKPPRKELFQRHFCAFTRPTSQTWPTDLASKLAEFKGTEAKKMESERALLSYFLATYQRIDADLIVTHDANDCQLEALCDRLIDTKIPLWSRIGRLKLNSSPKYFKVKDFFIGRMICDIKLSAEDLKVKSKSFDLDTLCKNVLNVDEGTRYDVSNDDLYLLYESGDDITKLISLTMQDCLFTTRIMCELNMLPLALQITNICGNMMGRTLQGGKSDRIEHYLLHAFWEKDYIVPDKRGREMNNKNEDTTVGRKKAAYSGGLVFEPVKGFYDNYILLMDFNSLYPSIIQEYNICFTTVIEPAEGEIASVPEPSAEQGILPRQIRRLVESRRQVKSLMAAPDLEPDLKRQYDIRQTALKLTANSMYGCLGHTYSRFYAQHLAALVTHKGREILTNTKSLVQKMNYEVVYGDTDSIMINTNSQDFDPVYRIGGAIKVAVNKIYKQIELEVDGVFRRLLLLKKKKYAALVVEKNKKGEITTKQELKGLDIVRRDWSEIAVIAGNLVVNEIMSDDTMDEKIDKIRGHLEKIGKNLKDGSVSIRLLTIKKQLTKAPNQYNNLSSAVHVAVALRMNQTKNRHFKKGDVINYVICEDGTKNAAMKRAYHIDEVNSREDLKIDVEYYLSNQVHSVVARLLEVIEEIDSQEIAELLGLDPAKYKGAAQKTTYESGDIEMGSSILSNHNMFIMCNKLTYKCPACKTEITIDAPFRRDEKGVQTAILVKCSNKECNTMPYHSVHRIRNAMIVAVRNSILRFYENWLVCDNTSCSSNTRNYCHIMKNRRPICLECGEGRLIRQYTAGELNNQLLYYQQMFDLSKQEEKLTDKLPMEIKNAYASVKRIVDVELEKSAYSIIDLPQLFTFGTKKSM